MNLFTKQMDSQSLEIDTGYTVQRRRSDSEFRINIYIMFY